MDDFVLVMAEEAQRLANHWQSLPAGRPVHMLEEMARLTARIIGRTVFGDDTSDTEALRVVHGFSAYQREVEQNSLLIHWVSLLLAGLQTRFDADVPPGLRNWSIV